MNNTGSEHLTWPDVVFMSVLMVSVIAFFAFVVWINHRGKRK